MADPSILDDFQAEQEDLQSLLAAGELWHEIGALSDS